ncbi:MAG TPA: MauE/DoxX family redox-associated membrane protein [Bacteroidales bacterium]|nr:MauE/DoxX family redox-associated membrane protein [Balneolales bacterium]HYX05422.1 MauE/DoxX family redox-associated membrane protein [Bacteroidales bacterium]
MSSNKKSLNIILLLIGRWFLSLILFIAVIGKLLNPHLFIQFIIAVFYTSTKFANVIFYITINIEIAIALSLIFWGNIKKWPAFSSFILFLLFTIIILYANHINLHVDCGCFGSFLKNKTANKIELYRDIIFSTIAFLIFIETPKSDNI